MPSSVSFQYPRRGELESPARFSFEIAIAGNEQHYRMCAITHLRGQRKRVKQIKNVLRRVGASRYGSEPGAEQALPASPN